MSKHTIEIPLTKGYTAIVDAQDADLAQKKWRVATHSNYAARQEGGRQDQHMLYLHRVILERIIGRKLVKGEQVDHINGNTRDNRRSNLRLVSHHQNMRNQKRNKANTSGYKGVSRAKGCPYRPWRAYIVINDKQIHLGHYATLEEAHEAYRKASEQYHGEYGRAE